MLHKVDDRYAEIRRNLDAARKANRKAILRKIEKPELVSEKLRHFYRKLDRFDTG